MSVASTVNSVCPWVTISPGLTNSLRDPARIGREDRRGAVLVDRDLAFGHVLGAECLLLAGFHCQRRPLRGGRIEQPARPLDWLEIAVSMSAALPVGCGFTAQTTAAPATTSDTTISACIRADRARTRTSE